MESYLQDFTMSAMVAALLVDVTKRITTVAGDGQQVIVTDHSKMSFSKISSKTWGLLISRAKERRRCTV